MTILTSTHLLRLGAAATAIAMALPALPAAAAGADAAPPARTLQLACPADRVTGADFVDTEGSVHGDSIACLAWYGIAQGTSADTYDGERAVTRAQLATFLSRVLTQAGVTLPADAADAFSDDENSAHERALNALAALGIVKGDGAGDVDPDEAVQRDQMASLLLRVLELIEDDELADAVEDYFDDDDDNVHHGAINALAGLGIAAGRSQGVFDPEREVRRDQLATFLMRLVDRLVEHDEVRLPLTLRLSAEEVSPGDVVHGEVIGEGVASVALRGCGVDGPVTDEDAEADGVQFSFVVPAAFPAEQDAQDGADDADAGDGADESADADETTDADESADDSAGSGDVADDSDGEVADECELEVVVTDVDGATVTLDEELEYADGSEGGSDEGAGDEGAEDEGAGDEAAGDQPAGDEPARDEAPEAGEPADTVGDAPESV